MNIKIEKDEIREHVKKEDVDYVYEELSSDWEFYFSNLCREIARTRGFNKGKLKVGWVVEYEKQPYEVTEVNFSAATIENINTGVRHAISETAYIKVLLGDQ